MCGLWSGVRTQNSIESFDVHTEDTRNESWWIFFSDGEGDSIFDCVQRMVWRFELITSWLAYARGMSDRLFIRRLRTHRGIRLCVIQYKCSNVQCVWTKDDGLATVIPLVLHFVHISSTYSCCIAIFQCWYECAKRTQSFYGILRISYFEVIEMSVTYEVFFMVICTLFWSIERRCCSHYNWTRRKWGVKLVVSVAGTN